MKIKLRAILFPLLFLTLACISVQAMDTTDELRVKSRLLCQRFKYLRLARSEQQKLYNLAGMDEEGFDSLSKVFCTTYESLDIKNPPGDINNYYINYYDKMCSIYTDLIKSNNLGNEENYFDMLFWNNIFFTFDKQVSKLLSLEAYDADNKTGIIIISEKNSTAKSEEFLTQLRIFATHLADLDKSQKDSAINQQDYDAALNLHLQEANSLLDNFTELSLSNCELGEIEIKILSMLLKNNKTLRSLDLSYNNLTTNCYEYLFYNLPSNMTLIELNLAGNAYSKRQKNIQGIIDCNRKMLIIQWEERNPIRIL